MGALAASALLVAAVAGAVFLRSGPTRSRPSPPRVPVPGRLSAAAPAQPLADLARAHGIPVDPIRGARLEVDKSDLELRFLAGDRLLKRYPVALGPGHGDKQRRGDGCTPEGEFRIAERVLKRGARRWNDAWMRLNYPLPEDAERGLAAGLIDEAQRDAIIEADRRGEVPPRGTALGSGIGIHLGGIDPPDWTEGCIALEPEDGIEVCEQVRVGTRVTVRP